MKLIKSTVTFTLYGMRMYLQRSIGFYQGFEVWRGGSSIKSCVGGCRMPHKKIEGLRFPKVDYDAT